MHARIVVGLGLVAAATHAAMPVPPFTGVTVKDHVVTCDHDECAGSITDDGALNLTKLAPGAKVTTYTGDWELESRLPRASLAKLVSDTQAHDTFADALLKIVLASGKTIGTYVYIDVATARHRLEFLLYAVRTGPVAFAGDTPHVGHARAMWTIDVSDTFRLRGRAAHIDEIDWVLIVVGERHTGTCDEVNARTGKHMRIALVYDDLHATLFERRTGIQLADKIFENQAAKVCDVTAAAEQLVGNGSGNIDPTVDLTPVVDWAWRLNR